MLLHVGGRVGYWRGDIAGLVDDIASLKPSLFIGVPRVFERIHGRVVGQIAAAGGLKKLLYSWGYARKLHFMRAGFAHDQATCGSSARAARRSRRTSRSFSRSRCARPSCRSVFMLMLLVVLLVFVFDVCVERQGDRPSPLKHGARATLTPSPLLQNQNKKTLKQN